MSRDRTNCVAKRPGDVHLHRRRIDPAFSIIGFDLHLDEARIHEPVIGINAASHNLDAHVLGRQLSEEDVGVNGEVTTKLWVVTNAMSVDVFNLNA